MADPREALLALAADWERHAPDRIVGQAVAADLRALAEFDVTPRGVHNHDIDPACPETRLPDGSLRGECTTNVTPPTVKPSLEQVVDVLAAQPPGNGEWTSSRIMQTARAVLALLPGRSEAEVYREGYDQGLRDAASVSRSEVEVKAETWDEVVDYLDRTNAPSIAEAARRDNPYRQEATRG